MVLTRSQRARAEREELAAAPKAPKAAPPPRLFTAEAAATSPPIPLELTGILIVLCSIACYSFLGTDGDSTASVARIDVSLASRGAIVPFAALAAARASVFVFMVHRLYVLVFVRPPFVVSETGLVPGTRFVPRMYSLVGRQRLVTFTVQAWTAQIAYFGLAAAAAYAGHRGDMEPRFVPLKLTRYLFELCWTVSHLVTAVSTYVLVPGACRLSYPAAPTILGTDQLILHNTNVAFMHLDALLSGQNLAAGHYGVPLMFACWYVGFAWIRARYVAGVLPYFFLDYSLPRAQALSYHLGLGAIVVGFFFLGVFLTTQLLALELALRIPLHAAVVYSIIRLRPPAQYRVGTLGGRGLGADFEDR